MADQRSPVLTIDLDSGAGTHLGHAVGLLLSASGGPIEAKGQKAMASSIPVALASDQSTLPVSIAATVTVDTELPTAAALADATANPTVPSVGSLNMLYNGTTWDRARGTTANGMAVDVTRVTGTVTVDAVDFPAAAAITDAFANPTTTSTMSMSMGWNGTTWDRLKSTTANGLQVDVTRVQGTVTVDSELAAAAALSDAFANPTTSQVGAMLMGWNTVTWDRLRSTTANGLVVDVSRVQGSVATTVASPTTPVNGYFTSASVAAGATANLDTADIGAQRLRQVEVWSSVATKVQVFRQLNSVVDTNPSVVGGGQAFAPFIWTSPHPDYVKTTASAGTDGFRVAVTNLDDANAADVYAVLHYEV